MLAYHPEIPLCVIDECNDLDRRSTRIERFYTRIEGKAVVWCIDTPGSFFYSVALSILGEVLWAKKHSRYY